MDKSVPVYSDWFLWFIGPLVFLSRWLIRSRPYFADSPTLIQAVQKHIYVIQPPGYWLYARLAGLFRDPAFGLSLINALASALGVMVFYLICLHLTSRRPSRLAAAAYASIYFAWFAGATQSSYAGELLFAPLLLLLMLRYRETNRLVFLSVVALSYALAAGVRPSDGVFLAPLFFFFLWRDVRSGNRRILTLALAGIFCLLWYIPQKIALDRAGTNAGNQLWSVARNEAPILHGFSKLALSNIVRTFFPLFVAFWSLLPAIFAAKQNPVRRMLWIWLIPGLAFFALVYISDATYLCFLLPAVILLALSPRPRLLTETALALCLASNVLFFWTARPIDKTRSLAVAIYSVSGARYCAWALEHRWYRTLDTYTDVAAIGRHPRSTSLTPHAPGSDPY